MITHREASVSCFLPRRCRRLHCIMVVLVGLLVVLHGVSLYRASSSSSSLDASVVRLPKKTTTTAKSLQQHQHQDTSCISDVCLEAQAAKLARVWQRRARRDWCVGNGDTNTTTTNSSSSNNNNNSNNNTTQQPPQQPPPPTTGLWLVKVPKSASSTMAGIVLRIAQLHQCPVRWQHGNAVDVFAASSQKQQRHETFRLAPIRHVYARTLSSVYYHAVSLQQQGRRGWRLERNKNNNTATPAADAYILRQLAKVEKNYISDYTRPPTQDNETNATSTMTSPASAAAAAAVVQDILQAYDFLIVVEELTASLVVLAWLADLNLSDVIIMSSKTTGSWYAANPRQCVALVPPVVTPAVQDYWQRHPHLHLTDRLLHAAARQSLHATIAHGMGRELFVQHLQQFQALQQHVQTACGAVMKASAPCSPTGVPQPTVAKQACFVRDFGCGHECVNRAVQEYTSNNNNSGGGGGGATKLES